MRVADTDWLTGHAFQLFRQPDRTACHSDRAACGNNAINATLYDKLNCNFIRDIVPVGSVIRFPYVMIVNPSVPATTVSEFIAYAKTSPGKINYASAGTGAPSHVTGVPDPRSPICSAG